MFEISLVTNPGGDGVLAIFHQDIYELVCDKQGCSWIELKQKLQVSRDDYVAMLIPDDLVSCKIKR